MSELFQISVLQPKDLESLQIVSVVSFYESFREGADPNDMQVYLQKELTLTVLKHEFQQASTTFVGVFDQEVLIGYMKLVYCKELQQLEVKRLYILSGYQNKRLGQALLDEAQKVALSKQCRELLVTVYEKNDAGLRFYQRNGFYAFDQMTVYLGKQARHCPILKKEIV